MNFSYIAGFFEGEGSIVTWKNKRGGTFVRVCIPQKNHPEILSEIQRFLGYGRITVDKRGTHRLTIDRKERVEDFITAVYPFMQAKRKRKAARLALRLIRLIADQGTPNKQSFDERVRLAEEIRKANHGHV